MDDDKPIFEVISHDGHHWKIWQDGTTEGFPDRCEVFNRYQIVLGSTISKVRKKMREGYDDYQTND